MGILNTVAEAATAANIALLALLVAVWGRNYRRFRSKHTLGLSVFAVLLLAQNSVGLYVYLWHPVTHDWWRETVPTVAVQAMMLLDVLEFGALAFLAWVSWD